MHTKKKILIDGLALLSPFTGVAKYTYENAFRLARDNSDNYEWFYDYGFHSKNLIKSDTVQPGETRLKKLKQLIVSHPRIKACARDILSLLGRIASPRYDLYWQPNYIPKKIKTRKTVTTVHDFSFHVQPDWHPEERLHYYRKHFWHAASASDWIITGSHFTKQEIVEYMGYPEEKITVIYHAVDHTLYKVYEESELESTKKRWKLPDYFLFFVGSIEPRKNLKTLLQAYHQLPVDMKETYPLILAGFKGWENEEIMREIEKERAHIQYLGYVTDEEMAHLYNLATLFVYPSLYEGFGIPPLEAMACGTAVLSSHAASLPEACGDAALYVDPQSSRDIAEKIICLLQDAPERARLAERGIAHAEEFTWERAARAHMEVFQNLLGESV